MRRTLIAFLCFGTLFALLTFTSKAPAVPDKAEAMKGAHYVGVDTCRKCHFRQYMTWKKSKHAHAWADLPAKYHDPAEKDEKGRSCVTCHTVGYGNKEAGGFVDEKTTPKLVNVQCEDCHGAGSKHKDAAEKLLAAGKKTFAADQETFIVRKTTRCADCHNPHVSHAKYKTDK